MSSFQLKGYKELDAALRTLPARLHKNVIRGAMRAGAKKFAMQVKFNVNKRTGRLARSLRYYSRVDRYTKLITGKARIGTGRGGDKRAFYAHFVEFGTKPHVIKAKDGKLLAIGYPQVNHPGSAPRAFARNAFRTSRTQAIMEAGKYIKKRLSTKHGIDIPDMILDAEVRP